MFYLSLNLLSLCRTPQPRAGCCPAANGISHPVVSGSVDGPRPPSLNCLPGTGADSLIWIWTHSSSHRHLPSLLQLEAAPGYRVSDQPRMVPCIRFILTHFRLAYVATHIFYDFRIELVTRTCCQNRKNKKVFVARPLPGLAYRSPMLLVKCEQLFLNDFSPNYCNLRFVEKSQQGAIWVTFRSHPRLIFTYSTWLRRARVSHFQTKLLNHLILLFFAIRSEQFSYATLPHSIAQIDRWVRNRVTVSAWRTPKMVVRALRMQNGMASRDVEESWMRTC